jgi:hypothetical protein
MLAYFQQRMAAIGRKPPFTSCREGESLPSLALAPGASEIKEVAFPLGSLRLLLTAPVSRRFEIGRSWSALGDQPCFDHVRKQILCDTCRPDTKRLFVCSKGVGRTPDGGACRCDDTGYEVTPSLVLSGTKTLGAPIVVDWSARDSATSDHESPPPGFESGDWLGVEAFRDRTGAVVVAGFISRYARSNGDLLPVLAMHPGLQTE